MRARQLRVSIRTLGCKVNRAESEALAEALLGAGVLVTDGDDADVAVVNTCTVTGEADAKARKEVRRALAACTGPVVVTGCLAALDADGLRALGDRVIVEADRATLAHRVEALLEHATREEVRMRHLTEPTRARTGETFRTRVMLKVQDGCDHRCSYCIVPDARGNPHSVPAVEILQRARDLATAGARELVLTGVNIGRYRDDAVGISGLPQLMDALLEVPIARLRVSSIEPADVDHRFVSTVAGSNGRIVPHLHIPLQSGDDATLAAMRRGYDTASYAAVLALVRDAVPGVAVTTDVMVGFPGESDAAFDRSLAFVHACAFARLHVFRYSRRADTPAASMPQQVPAPVKAERARRMRTLSDELARAHVRARAGGRASVLVERIGTRGAVGTTEDGLRVRVVGAPRPEVGTLVTVVLGADANGEPEGRLL